VDTFADSFYENLRELGKTLLEADEVLNGKDVKALRAHCLTIWTQADLKAAVAVASGELDERLLPSGLRCSKVVSLAKDDQDRLLSDERFEVYSQTGKANKKTWAEMTLAEKDRLLGAKGSYIHEIADQVNPVKTKQASFAAYGHASFDDGLLKLTTDRRRGEIPVRALQADLIAKGQLQAFIAALIPETGRAAFVASLLTDDELAELAGLLAARSS
jgi:hypothetical protein